MKTTIAIFLATVFLAGGFFGGYFLAPDKIVEVEVEKIVIVEKIVEVEVEKIVIVEKIVEVERENTIIDYAINPATLIEDAIVEGALYDEDIADEAGDGVDEVLDWLLG